MRAFLWLALCIPALLSPSLLLAQSSGNAATPRALATSLLSATQRHDPAGIRGLLDTTNLPDAQRARVAQEVAYALMELLEVPGALVPEQLPDTPNAEPTEAAVLSAGGQALPLVFARTTGPSVGWRVAAYTVDALHDWLQNQPVTWPARLLPRWVRDVRVLGMASWQWVDLWVMAALALVFTVVAARLLRGALTRLARQTAVPWDDALVALMVGPSRMFIFLATAALGSSRLHLTQGGAGSVRSVLTSGSMVALMWFGFRAIRLAATLLEERTARGATDPVRVRAVHTQIRVLSRVAQAVIWVLGLALIFTQFEVMRQVGTSLLASAGVAGVVLGVAAQRSIGMLLAGLQLSFTQPIRLGDKVVLDQEFGEVEEITLTYVVLKLWDGRRMVVPITRFLEQTFQNWTLRNTELLGAAMIYADYTAPVEALRNHLHTLVKGFPEHDGKHCSLLVTGMTDKVLELRALVSAPDADQAFTLRCKVREAMTTHLQTLEGGVHLPRSRSESTTTTTVVSGQAAELTGTAARTNV